jgi:hypothetical protein
MTRSIVHSEKFLLARASTDNEREPDWPPTTRCRRCGADTWRVVTPDGEDIVLDTAPLEVELGGRCDGDVRRAKSSIFWKEARFVDGWRLEDPVEGIGQWLWGATSASLAQALVEPLYSEHVYTCSGAHEREVRSLVTAVRGPKETTHPRPSELVVHVEPQLPAAQHTSLSRLSAEQLSLWGG